MAVQDSGPGVNRTIRLPQAIVDDVTSLAAIERRSPNAQYAVLLADAILMHRDPRLLALLDFARERRGASMTTEEMGEPVGHPEGDV